MVGMMMNVSLETMCFCHFLKNCENLNYINYLKNNTHIKWKVEGSGYIKKI